MFQTTNQIIYIYNGAKGTGDNSAVTNGNSCWFPQPAPTRPYPPDPRVPWPCRPCRISPRGRWEPLPCRSGPGRRCWTCSLEDRWNPNELRTSSHTCTHTYTQIACINRTIYNIYIYIYQYRYKRINIIEICIYIYISISVYVSVSIHHEFM